MKTRRLLPQLQDYLDHFPAVALLGPRQVGKTTLAQIIASERKTIYLDLESPADRAKLADPLLYFSGNEDALIILDEVQRLPELFQILRGVIDKGRAKGIKSGRFLLLGSASIELLKQSGESLAGRIAYLELTPFDLTEVEAQQMNQLWERGGFPDSFLASDALQSMRWRQNFITTYLERDIPALGPRIPAETLRRFWTMLAHSQGTLLNASQLAKSLAVSGRSVARYLDLLVDLLLVRRLAPWHSNQGKRLVKSPRVFVRDSGLLHALLGIGDFESLMGHPVAGVSWEGFVVESLINLLPEHSNSYFYRSIAGSEIDLLLELPNKEIWAVEVKRNLSPSLSKGFYQAQLDIKPARSYVVYPGEESYPLAKDIQVVSLRTLSEELRAIH